MITTTTPRIYVACLASYNAGILHGRWIDADQAADDIRAEIAEMLSESPTPGAEEFAIHDYEGFHGLVIGEYDDIDRISELAILVSEHGEPYAVYADHIGIDCATPEEFENSYRGRWDNLQDYAEKLIDDCYDLDRMMGNLACYFDFERFARDLGLSNNVFTVESADGGIHVFYNWGGLS